MVRYGRVGIARISSKRIISDIAEKRVPAATTRSSGS
jgi:hypothetical protein